VSANFSHLRYDTFIFRCTFHYPNNEMKMSWKFCATSPLDAILTQCDGSMDEGDGWGDGYGYGNGRGHGGDGRDLRGDGVSDGYGNGSGYGNGGRGNGWSPKEWE